MPTISQAEINRLAYKQGVKPEEITSQLQSKGYTAPATTQEAGITLPGVQSAPTSGSVSPVAPTTQPIGSVSSILGDMGAGDNFYNQYYQDQLNAYNAPIDEAAIRKQKESEFQAQIDAINAVYADKLRQEKTTSQGRLGSSRAVQARSGLLGSDFGTAQTENIAQLNREQEQSVENERLALVSQVLSGAQKSAADEIAAKRAAKEAGGREYLNYLANAQTRKTQRTQDAARKLLALGKSPQDITDEELRSVGISRSDLITSYTDAQTALAQQSAKDAEERAKAQLEQQKTQAEIDKIAADIQKIGADASMYYEVGNQIFEKGTNNFIGYASKLGGARGTGGGGGGGVGAGVIGAGANTGVSAVSSQPGFKKLKAAEQKQALSLDNLSRELNKYKQIIAEADIGEYGVELFGKNSGLIESQLNALLFAAAQAEGTGALQAADRQVLEKVIPNPTTIAGAFTSLKSGGLEGVYAKIDNQIRKYNANLANLGITPTSNYQVQTAQPTTTTVAPATGTTSTGAKFTIKTK